MTFTCYGTRLHGDQRLSVDRTHNQFNTPFLTANPSRYKAERKRLRFAPYWLDQRRRRVVGASFLNLCRQRSWNLISFHVRIKHVHLVLSAAVNPRRILIDLKSEASRQLNLAKLDRVRRNRWTRGGSKIYLWTPQSVVAAVDYVLNHQGKAMERYLADEKWLRKGSGTE